MEQRFLDSPWSEPRPSGLFAYTPDAEPETETLSFRVHPLNPDTAALVSVPEGVASVAGAVVALFDHVGCAERQPLEAEQISDSGFREVGFRGWSSECGVRGQGSA